MPEKFWGRRFRPMIVAEDEESQIRRLKYLTGQGVADDLIESPLDWPNLNPTKAILDDEPLVGYWFNRDRERRARLKGLEFEKYDFATRYEVHLQPPPALRHLPPEEYRELIRRLVREVEEEAAAARGGKSVLGVERILKQDPLVHPTGKSPKKSPAPMLISASDPDEYHRIRGDFEEFLVDYRSASALSRVLSKSGGGLSLDPSKEVIFPKGSFPQGCFPPALPFIGASPPPCPPTPPTRRLEYSENGKEIVGRGPIPVIRVPRCDREAVKRNCRAPPS